MRQPAKSQAGELRIRPLVDQRAGVEQVAVGHQPDRVCQMSVRQLLGLLRRVLVVAGPLEQQHDRQLVQLHARRFRQDGVRRSGEVAAAHRTAPFDSPTTWPWGSAKKANVRPKSGISDGGTIVLPPSFSALARYAPGSSTST